VNVVLQTPTGGASLGSITTASVEIVDVDPDTTPPEVSVLSWNGTSHAITSIALAFDAPLNSALATDGANYRLISAKGQIIGLRAISYSSATDSVTIIPTAPLGMNQYFQIVVLGTGPTAIRDIAGNILDGAGNGVPGSNYVAWFAQGNKLQYTDSGGNQVKINLNGPGYLEQIRDSSGDGELLEIVGAVSHKTALSGSVRRVKRSSGQTQLGAITGLGSFGNIKVLMTSPPFMVKQYPFQRRGRGVL
jgi:hypothetical protein